MVKTDPTDGLPGLRLETGASILLRDLIQNHMQQFHHAIRRDKAASQSVLAAYVDGLAGAIALTAAGGLCSLDELFDDVSVRVRESVVRDLKHLRKT